MTAHEPPRRHFLRAAAAMTSLCAGGVGLSALSGCAKPYSAARAAQFWPPIGEQVRVGGLGLHVWDRTARTSGRPGAPVVLIHGASGNLRDWTFSIAPELAAERRVIAIDRPGFGYSERPAAGAGDPRAQAALLRRAVAAMGVKRPIVAGHSLGGAVAMAWALDAPGEVAGVVVISGVASPYEGAAQLFGGLGVQELAMSLYAEYLKSTVEDGGVERFVRRVFKPQTPPPGYVDYVGGPLALRQSTLDANIEDIAGLNPALTAMAPAYPGLNVPVEILHGDQDFISVEKQARPLAAVLPNARLTVLKGVGHMAHHAAPDALASALRRIDLADEADA